MDFNNRKVRLSLEPLEMREAPAQIVALPYPAAPEAQIALTAPFDLGKDEQAGDTSPEAVSAQKVKFQDIHFTGKVQVQDFHFVMKVNKSSP